MRIKSFDQFISWARYLYWFELNRQRFDQLTQESDSSSPSDKWKWWAFMSQFYSSLWVVIEGWQTLKLKDHNIEYLIAGCPQYCRLLKKFRDSVYHCSPTLLDSRSLEFVKQCEAAAFWAMAIHEEFQRFYWKWPETVMKSPEQVDEMRKHLLELVGWLPTNLIQVHKPRSDDLMRRGRKGNERGWRFFKPACTTTDRGHRAGTRDGPKFSRQDIFAEVQEAI